MRSFENPVGVEPSAAWLIRNMDDPGTAVWTPTDRDRDRTTLESRSDGFSITIGRKTCAFSIGAGEIMSRLLRYDTVRSLPLSFAVRARLRGCGPSAPHSARNELPVAIVVAARSSVGLNFFASDRDRLLKFPACSALLVRALASDHGRPLAGAPVLAGFSQVIPAPTSAASSARWVASPARWREVSSREAPISRPTVAPTIAPIAVAAFLPLPLPNWLPTTAPAAPPRRVPVVSF